MDGKTAMKATGTTEQDARAIAYLAGRLRDETHGAAKWDQPGIWAIVSGLIGRNLAVTIEQVTRHAADPEAKTPGAILRPFTPEAPGRQPARPPKRADECPHHPGQWSGSCGGCAVDAATGTPKPPARHVKSTPPPEWHKARAAMRGGTEED